MTSALRLLNSIGVRPEPTVSPELTELVRYKTARFGALRVLAAKHLPTAAKAGKKVLNGAKSVGSYVRNNPGRTVGSVGGLGAAGGLWHLHDSGKMDRDQKTGLNPFKSNFFGYGGGLNPFNRSVINQAVAIDKKIDDYNQRQWDKNPDPKAKILVNRGSTFSRNGKAINIGGVTPEQRRTAIDIFDAIHRSGLPVGKLPAIRPPGLFHYFNELVARATAAGMYTPALNTVYLRANTGRFSPEYIVGHEMGHWAEAQRPSPPSALYMLSRFFNHPFSGSASASAEFNADAEAYRLDQLRHPESRMPERKEVLDATSAGRPLP